jgi:hypothetical protein
MIDTERSVTKSSVKYLFLWAWEPEEPYGWKNILGLKDKVTALSDYLHNCFQNWINDYIFPGNEFTKTFEKFEILAGLAYLSLSVSKTNLEKKVSTQGNYMNREFEWFPVGRASWDSETRAKIISEINNHNACEILLNAGFCDGDEEYFFNAIKNMNALMDNLASKW